MSSTTATIGELIGVGTSSYSAYMDERNAVSDDAVFATTMVSVTSTLLGIFSEPKIYPYLNGISSGVSAGSNAALIGFGINALGEAKTPAEGLSAALNIIGGVSGVLATFAPPGPAKVAFSAISVVAGVAELAVKQNKDTVNSLINDVNTLWHSAIHYIADLGVGFGLSDTFSPETAAAATAAIGTSPLSIDPLALDLNGDGLIETTSTRDGTVVLFDHNADGVRTGTGWVKPNDGWLVLDRNSNGTIDSGRELFGVDTFKRNGQLATDGFDAIKDQDINNDGKITTADSVFANLRIWRDLNQDGISQANELSTLAANRIVSIGVSPSDEGLINIGTGSGNVQTAAGTFTRSNGTTGATVETNGTAANLDLLADTFYREFTDHLTLTAQAKALPELKGSGQVRDLSEAISLSADLGNWVKTYSEQTTRDAQINRLDGFIEKWANTSRMKSLKGQADALAGKGVSLAYNLQGLTAGTAEYNIFIKKLGIVERFMGFTYGGENGEARLTALDTRSGNITVSLASDQIANIALAYDRFKADIYESLLLETRLSRYFNKLDITLNNNAVALDFREVEVAFKASVSSNPKNGILDLIEFLSATGENRLQNLGWKASEFLENQLSFVQNQLGGWGEELSSWAVRFLAVNEHKITGSSRGDLIVATAGDDSLWGGNGNDTLLGRGGDDTLRGEGGDDILNGGDGNDIIEDTSGHNIVSGGNGNDTINARGTIEGGKGNDTIVNDSLYNRSTDVFIFNLGDGKDTIRNYSTGFYGYNDTLKLGQGIAPSSVTFQRSADHLILKFNANDQITFEDWFGSGDLKIDSILFADGTLWGALEFRNKIQYSRYQQPETGSIRGWVGMDNIQATSGDDWVYGLEGDDTLSGGAGNDLISGGTGDDVLDGGDGNDKIYGGKGSNTIHGGAGNDTIEVDGTNGEGNRLISIKSPAGPNNTVEGGKGNDQLISYNKEGQDIFIFNLGDGQDIIENYTEGMAKDDTLKLGVGIKPTDMKGQVSGDNLIIKFNANDQITFKNWMSNAYFRMDKVQFADGTVWGADQVNNRVSIGRMGTEQAEELRGWAGMDNIRALGGNDTVHGMAGDDTIDGGAGDDTLWGWEGNDTLIGGDGNDKLYANEGDDTLNGGVGSDELWGYAGNDTYIIDNTGDVITESANAGTDLVQSSITHTLGSNVENLTLTGTAALNGTGNALNNALVGNRASYNQIWCLRF